MEHPQREDLAASHGARLTAWCLLWRTPGLEHRLRISWSTRMRRSLGRCEPAAGTIRISARLAQGHAALLEEVLCHEAAHVAAHALHGRRCRSHGPEWAALMRAAGFPPRASIRVRLPGAGSGGTRAGKRYLHRCPVCGTSRVARTAAARWRCAACARAGLDGELEITRLTPPAR
jgi:predicted SprT family Zn-dependent metalloprotease